MKQRTNSPMINGGKLKICVVVFISDPISLTLGHTPADDMSEWLASRSTWQMWRYRSWHGRPTLRCEHWWLNSYLFYGGPKSPKIRVSVWSFHTTSAPTLLSPVCLHSFLKLLLQWPRTPPSEGWNDEFIPNFFLWFLLMGSLSKTSKRSSHSRQSWRKDSFHASPQDWPGTVTQNLVGLYFQIPLYLHKLPLACCLSRNPTLAHGCWVEYTEQKVYKGSIFLLPTKISKSLLFCTAA